MSSDGEIFFLNVLERSEVRPTKCWDMGNGGTGVNVVEMFYIEGSPILRTYINFLGFGNVG